MRTIRSVVPECPRSAPERQSLPFGVS